MSSTSCKVLVFTLKLLTLYPAYKLLGIIFFIRSLNPSPIIVNRKGTINPMSQIPLNYKFLNQTIIY